MSYQYFDSLPADAKQRYEAKLAAVGLKDCPYQLPGNTWRNDPTAWPDFQFADLYMYLISTPGVYTHQAMKAYKSLEAHRYFSAGFVKTVHHLTSATGFLVFQAEVRPSQRANDPSHQPWVATNKDGEVQAAHCTCMSGLGESCSHVAALLFKIEAAVRLGVTSVACTSKPCEWNNYSSNKVQPAPIHAIKFYNQGATRKVESNNRKRRSTSEMAPSSSEEQRSFLESLSLNESTPVACSLFSSVSTSFKSQRILPPAPRLPATLRSHYQESNKLLNDTELKKKCEELVSSFSVTKDEASYLEEKTRLQAKSTLWHEHRAGHITASSAHGVLHTNPESPAPLVILKLTKPNTATINSASLMYGRDDEEKVFRLAGECLRQKHKDCELHHSGMLVCDGKPWLSASADGIVKCSCHGKRVLEIKCPYSARDKDAEEFMNDKASYMYGGHLKKEHQYYTQVQLEMFVHEVEACEFVVYVKNALILETIPRDNDFLSAVLPKLEAFWMQHIVLELLTRSLENGDTQVRIKDDKLYCYCQQKWDGLSVLVGCDGQSCPYEWIHLGCIRPVRKKVPKGTWYCKACRNKRTKTTEE